LAPALFARRKTLLALSGKRAADGAGSTYGATFLSAVALFALHRSVALLAWRCATDSAALSDAVAFFTLGHIIPTLSRRRATGCVGTTYGAAFLSAIALFTLYRGFALLAWRCTTNSTTLTDTVAFFAWGHTFPALARWCYRPRRTAVLPANSGARWTIAKVSTFLGPECPRRRNILCRLNNVGRLLRRTSSRGYATRAVAGAAQVGGADCDCTLDIRGTGYDMRPHLECTDWSPGRAGDNRRRNTGIDGKAAVS
jgi:hypothetical protein